MGFLDNLESSLKNLEGNEERDTGLDRERRQQEREQARAAAPYADQLKKSTFTHDLLGHAVRLGHSSRTKVNMAWLGTTLRLDARERRLELRPTAEGIVAVFLQDGDEISKEDLNLESNPESLAKRLLDFEVPSHSES
jgi:hypothetical protein